MIDTISIVIPTLGKKNNLERLLKSIDAQEFIKSTYEVLIVVNGSQTNSRMNNLVMLPKQYTAMNLKVHFINEQGVNRARNYGLNLAQYALVLFLDDDCELPSKNFISSHLLFHKLNPQCFATGGGYLLAVDSKYLDEIYNYIQMKWYISGAIEGKKNRYLLGGNFSIKVEIAKKHNLLFDEKILYGGSEYEFFKKAEHLGLEMLVNEFGVVHHTQESILTLSKKVFKQGRGKAHIDAKYVYNNKTTYKIQNRDKIGNNQIIKLYFNYIFWLGYYFYQKKYFTIVLHIMTDIINKVNFFRFKFLKEITKRIGEKKDKGDRF